MQVVCGQHTTDPKASGSQRTPECHNRAGGALRQTGRMVRQDLEAAAHKRQVGCDAKAAERKRQGVVYSHRDGPYKPVRSGLGYVIHQTKLQRGAAAAGGLRMRRAGFGAYSSFDGLAQFHIAYKKVFYTVKGLMSIHIRDIHIRNLICDTNKQERLNGELAGPLCRLRWHKKRGLDNICHRHNLPQLHQAARGNRRQDACPGRQHRDTGRRHVADPNPERRIPCVTRQIRPIMPDIMQLRAILPVCAALPVPDFDKNGPRMVFGGKHSADTHPDMVQN